MAKEGEARLWFPAVVGGRIVAKNANYRVFVTTVGEMNDRGAPQTCLRNGIPLPDASVAEPWDGLPAVRARKLPYAMG